MMSRRRTMRWVYPPNEAKKLLRRPPTLVGQFYWPKMKAELSYPADCRWWNYRIEPGTYVKRS